MEPVSDQRTPKEGQTRWTREEELSVILTVSWITQDKDKEYADIPRKNISGRTTKLNFVYKMRFHVVGTYTPALDDHFHKPPTRQNQEKRNYSLVNI